jgi:hypothetical protein
MKIDLRRIMIDHAEYLYYINTQYNKAAETNLLTLRIFLNGQKQTPLIIEFLTLDDHIMGQPLNVGITLINKKDDLPVKVNINEPKWIRELILLGLKNGWTGTNKIEKQDGLKYLTDLGFDVTNLLPKKIDRNV